MSLDVSPQLLAEAENGEVREEDFVETVRTSLPYAYDLIAGLVTELRAGSASGTAVGSASGTAVGSASGTAEFADNQTPPPSERERGQLLRALSSDAIRGSLERHFGVALAFQNCHRVAVFPPQARGGETYARFTSLRSQILNQSPEFRDC
ncbi:SCO5389 family protein [Streptomyces sp. NPDC046862]|uniref:SCO5389 family protein n=1 Tax=Streptomyces sp. NPDC046862 TaxID=3154603 RepID=UPI003453705D